MALSDNPESASRIEAALFRLTKVLVFRDHPPAALADLPLSQLRCVRVIGENEGAKMQDMAHHLHITLPALSQLVDRLVRRGMVERHADAEDRRIARLFLSESARALFRQIREERLDRVRIMMSRMEPSEAESAIEVLERMAESAEQSRNPIGVSNAQRPADSNAEDAVHIRASVPKSEVARMSPKPAGAGQ